MSAAAASPAVAQQIDQRVAAAVRQGLASRPKRLPPWLFYDEAGSQLFEAITELPEYYLTRTERGIFAANAKAIIAQAAGAEQAADGARLRIAELGAGSAEKTRLLLKAAVERQRTVLYEPVDVSASALDGACERIEREIPGVTVTPRVMDYTHGDGHSFHLDEPRRGERQLVLYIGSSIGNFEPGEAAELLQRVRAGLKTGDSFLLGVDLVKDEARLLAAYDDAAGVTAAFNRNLLVSAQSRIGRGLQPGGIRAPCAVERRRIAHRDAPCEPPCAASSTGLRSIWKWILRQAKPFTPKTATNTGPARRRRCWPKRDLRRNGNLDR